MERLSYLLDSNILSEPSRPHPNIHVQSRLLAYRHAVCTAALVLHEMYYGLPRCRMIVANSTDTLIEQQASAAHDSPLRS
jgi:predicted nucleic acid-binding protein